RARVSPSAVKPSSRSMSTISALTSASSSTTSTHQEGDMAHPCITTRSTVTLGQFPIPRTARLLCGYRIDVKDGVERADERAAFVRVAGVELHADLTDVVGGEAGDRRLRCRQIERQVDPGVERREHRVRARRERVVDTGAGVQLNAAHERARVQL